jgi:hypothetical protein
MDKAETRLRLLIKRHLTPELWLVGDEIELKRISAQINQETPRYTEESWAMLSDALELLKELEESNNG